jgi:hypothetical protein
MQLDFATRQAQYLDVNARENSSWLGRLVIGLLLTLIGGAVTAVIIQIQVGNITVIVGDHNKVENGSQTQSVVQPTKPAAGEVKTQQPASETVPSTVNQVTPVQETSTPTQVAQSSSARRTSPTRQYESEEDCTCPDEEEEADTESQPQPYQPTYTTNPTYVSAPARVVSVPNYSQYQTQTQSSQVYVQSGNGVSVRTSATATGGGQSHTRVVVNGKVIVDQ